MIDAFVILTPIFLLAVFSLIHFIGCGTLLAIDDVQYAGEKEQTSMVLNSSKNPSTVGEEVIFTTTLTGVTKTPYGPVDLKEPPVNIDTQTMDSSARAVFKVSSLTAGIHNINGAYGGNNDFYPCLSPVLPQVVVPAQPATKVVTLGAAAQPAQKAGNPPISATLANTRLGSLIVVTVSWAAGNIAISDGAANTYASVGTSNWSGQRSQTFFAINKVAGNLVITAGGAGTTGPCSLVVAEFVDADSAAPVYSFANQASPTTGGALTVNVSPVNVGDLIYAVSFARNGNLVVGAGFLQDTASALAPNSLVAAHKPVTAAGSDNVKITNTVAASPWVLIGMVIKHA